MSTHNDFSNPEQAASSFNRIASNDAKRKLLSPRYYCYGQIYHSIDEIEYNDDVDYYYQKIKNLRWSDGTYINLAESAWYARLCYAFDCHLYNVEHSKLSLEGQNIESLGEFKCKMSLQYRTSKRYREKQVAKCYALIEELQKVNIKDVTLVTFTTSQKNEYGQGREPIEQHASLIRDMQKMHDLMRKDYKFLGYVHVCEAHESGYMHVHRLYPCRFSDEDMKKYQKIWSEKYNAGHEKFGLQFSFNDNDVISRKKKKPKYQNDLNGALRYLIKYLHKSIADTENQSFKQFFMDACIWYVSKRTNYDYKGIRTFYISPKLYDFIRERFKKKSALVIFHSIILHYCDTEIILKSEYLPEDKEKFVEVVKLSKQLLEDI